MGKVIDMTNQKFGKWTVISKDPKKYSDREIRWVCKCDCGTIRSVRGTALRNGSSKSCGCRKTELCKELGKKRFKDLSGKKFGKLQVIKPLEKDNQGNVKFLCECECGEFTSVRGNSLISENTQSCGKCSSISIGENKIKQLLEDNGIYYEYQKTFKNCRYEDTNSLVRFDFVVDEKYIIEFDVRQHFEYDRSGWNSKENFEKTKERDAFRDKWCRENGLPIIRIPYTKLKELTIKDLLLQELF